jgi:hypothetical protein
MDSVGDSIASLRAALTASGLDSASAILSEALGPEMKGVPGVIADDGGARCFWAGKELDPAKLLSDFTGRNEKTKIVVRLGRAGAPPPLAPSKAEDAEATRKLLAEMHRRKEEAERLAADDDDGYLRSEWADSSGLKKQMTGLTSISWKPQ